MEHTGQARGEGEMRMEKTPFTITNEEQARRICLAGDLVSEVVPTLQAAVRDLIGAGCDRILIDLAASTMLDSAGICLLIAANNTLAARQGTFAVTNVRKEIYAMLNTMRLTSRLDISCAAAGECA